MQCCARVPRADKFTQTYINYVRDLPGGFQEWVENMTDQSHVAFAHHTVAGNRCFSALLAALSLLGPSEATCSVLSRQRPSSCIEDTSGCCQIAVMSGCTWQGLLCTCSVPSA
jgi:hypothetical protein